MRLYNSLTRQVEELEIPDRELKMYVCGLTVYDDIHLGHALSFVAFDVLHRWLRYRGARVKFVRNYTDIDDRIVAKANAEGVTYQQISERYIKRSEEIVEQLNLLPPDVSPRATEEIPQVIDFIQTLIDRNAAYAADGNVYFAVDSYSEYGGLSGRTLEELESASQEGGDGKRSPHDFALWKASKPGEPYWPTPWGDGRPGWHIECSAMILHHLGDQIDIHGGGIDLLFPHHENERAQSEVALGVSPFARFWVHNGLLNLVDGQKMSKSLGNSLMLHRALEVYPANAVKLWMLQSHYRAPILLNEDNIEATRTTLERLRETLGREALDSATAELDPGPYITRFEEQMDDNLNTPRALAVLFELRTEINRAVEQGMLVSKAQDGLRKLLGVLGIEIDTAAVAATPSGLSDSEVEEIIKQRAAARGNRDFALADKYRDQLQAAGIEIKDRPDRTYWSRITR